MIETRFCTFTNNEELELLVELQNEVYKQRGLIFKKELFKHWYADNPIGKVISCNAFSDDKMIAHQSFVPEQMLVEGRIVQCLRSMAVVTHPDFQGNGLFSQLTNQAIEEAKRQGYEFIYAITNGNSFPAFIKHCGFSSVTQLTVKMGFGLNIHEDGEKTYKRYWTDETLRWRMSRGSYCRINDSIIGDFKPGILTYMGTLDTQLLDSVHLPKKSWNFGLKLYVGKGALLPITYFKVPPFIKHSPFHVIFRDLTEKLPKMTEDNIFIQLIDDDVA